MRGDYNELVNEIESEKRQEKLFNIWHKWKYIIISIPIIILSIVAFYSCYNSYQNKIILYYSDLYEEGKQKILSGYPEEGIKILEKIPQNGKAPNYTAMAQFTMAEYFISKKDFKKVEEIYTQISENKKIESFYRRLAQLRLVQLHLDTNQKNYAQDLNSIESILTQEKSLIPMALEMKAYILYLQNEFRKARDTYIQIAQMENCDPSTRSRAQAMTRLIIIKHLKRL